ncbi:MAG: flotillin-like FloA family protein [Planctomycetota bacterium]
MRSCPIGSATNDTVIAHVGEGLVWSIGFSNSHTELLEKPESI